jgi:PAS domain S-box-containing protein
VSAEDRELALLQAAFEASGAAILAVDTDGAVTAYNQRFLDLWGFSEDDTERLKSRDTRIEQVASHLNNGEQLADRVRQIYGDPEMESLDVLELKDGRSVECVTQPLRLAGKVIGRVWSFRDVSYQRRIEKDLREIAFRDTLTGLFNRRRAEETLEAAIRSRRSADNAPIDVYYYGLTSGTSGGQSGCAFQLSTANSTSKAAAGWNANNDRGPSTMAHELGHSHGRNHAPCGNVGASDGNYPYPNADIGVWGYDFRIDTFLPPTRIDMMSYCPNPDRTLAWLSDYTYRALVQRVASVNALARRSSYEIGARTAARTVPWRQLVVDSFGARWGEYPLLVDGVPEGGAVQALVYDRRGISQTIEVYRLDMEDELSHEAYMLTVPQPENDWYALEIPGLLRRMLF